MVEFSRDGKREILNLHQRTSILHGIAIGTQVDFHADQERSKGPRHGMFIFILLVLCTKRHQNASLINVLVSEPFLVEE